MVYLQNELEDSHPGIDEMCRGRDVWQLNKLLWQ